LGENPGTSPQFGAAAEVRDDKRLDERRKTKIRRAIGFIVQTESAAREPLRAKAIKEKARLQTTKPPDG